MTGTPALRPGIPDFFPPLSATAVKSSRSTFEDECRELWAAATRGLQTESPDPDHTAACTYLLRHLAFTTRA